MTVVDSTELYRKALVSFSNPNPSPPPPHLPPIPSTFPQSKLIPGTRFAVDAFRHAGDFSVTYFLSHFHSDHYSGLSPFWSHGLVFCSPLTASLLTRVLRLSPLFVVPLPLNLPHLIDGCHVSLVDANHCPGAVQFLFRLPRSDRKYLHTATSDSLPPR